MVWRISDLVWNLAMASVSGYLNLVETSEWWIRRLSVRGDCGQAALGGERGTALLDRFGHRPSFGGGGSQFFGSILCCPNAEFVCWRGVFADNEIPKPSHEPLGTGIENWGRRRPVGSAPKAASDRRKGKET
ncbi:hypothetical protein ColLi_06379 [Colletotrichum liriopes]|uniref:Uncharacterized protein n=1 Tax=Colletotrichum liriopes TaxID=708192 RepID=A0AA37GNI8_9PEZI|nr:hypothetical protein ColLi_06379 [Colletotrichum liriopes]